jgi:hypothetical protein
MVPAIEKFRISMVPSIEKFRISMVPAIIFLEFLWFQP